MQHKPHTDDERSREAVIRFVAEVLAETDRSANLTANYLNRLGFPPGKEAIPLSFALAITSIARIEAWELQGLKAVVAPKLPGSDEALAKLAQVLVSAPETLQAWAQQLHRAVFAAWLWQTARTIHHDLGVEFAWNSSRACLSIEDLAQFLWRHRHLANGLSASVSDEGTTPKEML